MAKYVLVLQQKGGGCDYTIGCGIDYHIIEAENDEEAMVEAEKYWCGGMRVSECEYPEFSGDHELEYMHLTKLIDRCPIEDWLTQVEERIQAEEDAEKEAEERKQLKELLNKYGMDEECVN